MRALSTAAFVLASRMVSLAVGIRHYGDDYAVIAKQLLLAWDKKDITKRARRLLTKKYHEDAAASQRRQRHDPRITLRRERDRGIQRMSRIESQ